MDALAALLHHSDDDDDQGDYVQTIEIGKDKAPAMRISVAPDDGQAPGTLFAYHIWNGATCLAEFFAEDPTLVRGRKVVEFGAASALPSLVALHFGAKVAGMTDYPADILLQNMRDNVERNRPLLNGTPVVQGHLWGSDTTALLSHTEENGEITGFDVAIVAECLWMHREVFLGNETREYKRATSAQRCVRAGGKHNDLDQVGFTARHHTCFEMLGNFSFGDYFKEEAILHAWTLISKEFALPIDKLHVTVLENDDEAITLWKKIANLPDSKIQRLGHDDNFWAMGDTGPCGPCSEIFYDQGEAFADADDRYLELWNLVFMQYNRQADGALLPLPSPCVDTGMGLERMTSVMQGVVSNYHTDLFVPHLQDLKCLYMTKRCRFQAVVDAEVASNQFGTDQDIRIVRVLADHLRTTYALLQDGVFPSNVGRGYVLRRILRRAMRFGQLAGVQSPFLSAIPNFLDDSQAVNQLQSIVMNEEKAFYAMLHQGEKAIDKLLHQTNHLTAKDAYFLYDTYGLTLDMTQAIVSDRGATVDANGFDELRAAAAAAQVNDSASLEAFDQQNVLIPTTFVGYDTTAVADATILHVEPHDKTSVAVTLSPCPFYAEGGGQVGDCGWLDLGDGRKLNVVDALRAGPETTKVYVKIPATTNSTELVELLKSTSNVSAHVDESLRQRTAVHHSATHVLQAALKETLGAHVTQCGSYVGPDRLRFDFSHFGGMTADEVAAVEARVNEVALGNLPVQVEEMEKAAAQASGAVATFGEKYGDIVRVVRVGSVSSEFCGGTHVASSTSLFPFVILSEASVAAGTRRIEAVAGIEGVKRLQEKNQLLDDLASKLNTVPAMASQKLSRMEAQLKASERYIQSITDRLVYGPISAWKAGHLKTNPQVPVQIHHVDLNAKADDKVLANMYMTALRRRAEHIAKTDPSAVHVVVMGENVMCMGNDHVHAGETLKTIMASGVGHGGGSKGCGQGKLRTDNDKLADAVLL
ncbi:unnamed protein product [Aphanomyces euteiches]